jgi:predicted Rossmann fold nucleotide-binding protein DprA/Smf involved in DNA uptake
MSVAKPDAGFSVEIAMARNRLIYAQSAGTVVVKSEYNKGGTWSGAVENLTKRWCPIFCWNNAKYKGNMELIGKGAIPVDESWDGNVSDYKSIVTIVPEQQVLPGYS